MNKAKLSMATCLIGIFASMPLIAEEQTSESEPKSNWKATAELGFVKASGNTDTQTLNAKLKASTAYDSWKHGVSFETLSSSSNDVRSAEKYVAQGKSDYLIDDRTYAFGLLSWEKDNFDGYDYQATAAVGLGYKVIQESDMELSFELAPGYRVSEFESGNNEEDGIIRAAENFSWDISKTATFDQFLNTEAGESNTITRFGVSLTSQIADALSMKVGYNLKHSSDVAVDKDKTDTETSVTLVYKL